MGLDVTFGQSNGATVVRVTGEVDLSTADRFAAAVSDRAAHGPVVVDLEGLTFMDSAGVRAIDRLLAAARARGWALRFSPAMRENVRQVLWLTGVLEVLPFAEVSR